MREFAKTEPGRPVLVIGAAGQIGSVLMAHLPRHGFAANGTARAPREGLLPLDLAEGCAAIDFTAYDSVVFCAGQTNIRACEEDPAGTALVNVTQSLAVMKECRAAGCFLLFLSSNAVFDGRAPFPTAGDPPCPKTEYGRQKLAVETALRGEDNAAILRLTKVVTMDAPFLRNWERQAAEGQPVLAFTNRMISPLHPQEVVLAIAAILRARRAGLYQLGGEEELSFHDYALRHFAGRAEKKALVTAAIDPFCSGTEHNSLRTRLP